MIATTAVSRAGNRITLARLALLLLGLVLLAVAGRARADCGAYFSQPGSINFAPPATITLPDSLQVGTVLWTSQPVGPTNPPTLICVGTTNSGIQNSVGSQPSAGDDTLFPIGNTGLSYRLFYPDVSNPLHAYPNQAINTGSMDTAVTLQLVATGPVAPGSTLPGGQLAQWIVQLCNFHNNACRGNQLTSSPVLAFSTSGITFVPPACSIITDPTVVTLPTVYASAFTSTGSTTGLTPFNVQLNCPSSAAGASLAITLATSSPVAGATGVIANTAGGGYAQNVGVQVLDSNGNPIPFGTAISAGTVTAGNINVPLNARYYQTGASVTAGQVNATATYTITYQ
ncbi:MAG: fimbrial protein [Rhodanobacteraceae bacterium]